MLVLLRHTRGLGFFDFVWLSLQLSLPHFVEVHCLKWPISAWKPLWIKTSQPLNVTGQQALELGEKPWDLGTSVEGSICMEGTFTLEYFFH